jgi:membrane associated rhomboid family serine protease
MSPRNQSFEMGLPPFLGAVRNLIIASVVIFLTLLLLHPFAPVVEQFIFEHGVLTPEAILHQGWLWQFVTYPFMYADPMGFAMSLLGIYFLGGAVESQIGARRLYGLFFGSLILAAMAGVALSLTGRISQGQAAGSGAAANAILMVFYLLNRGAPIMLFPLPLQIPVKWIVVAVAAIESAYLIRFDFQPLQLWILLLGLASGYLWYLLFLRRRVSLKVSERVYGLRNAYYRWKRRRAAKKFQVYMRKHDRTVYFDEYGNYKPPEDKPGDGKGGWVN